MIAHLDMFLVRHIVQKYTRTRLTRNIMSYGPKAAERIAGKTVFLTGASSGIGQATALELTEAAGGDLRIILAARRAERLEELKKEIEKRHQKAEVLAFPLDVSKHREVAKTLDEKLPKEWSNVDILINNAGLVYGSERVGEYAQDDIDGIFYTNVLGLISLTQYFMPKFRAQDHGDIVNIGSIAGLDPYPNGSIYCASKAAVRSFTHSLRKETLDTRIRVMEVQPGAVETEFSIVRNRGDVDKAKAVYKGTEPLLAEDIAEIITFNLTRRQNTVVADTLVFPSHQASAAHIYRKPE